MESSMNEGLSKLSEGAYREMQLKKDNEAGHEVPEVARDSSQKVTKSPEPIQLSGSFAGDKTLAEQTQSLPPGDPMESVDNVDDAGIDPTKDPDWAVVKDDRLPPQPGPSQFHNDRYWEERSLDRELQDKDLQEEMIRRETEEFSKAAEGAEDFGRSNSNELLDPYYQTGSDSSDPPSAGNSLDSFI